MVADYEAMWLDLLEEVGSKTQHGREGLLTKMAEIAARHRVPPGQLSSLLRLYGVEVERARALAATAETDRDSIESFGGGPSSLADADRPGHHDRGGHDGSRNGGTRAVTG